MATPPDADHLIKVTPTKDPQEVKTLMVETTARNVRGVQDPLTEAPLVAADPQEEATQEVTLRMEEVLRGETQGTTHHMVTALRGGMVRPMIDVLADLIDHQAEVYQAVAPLEARGDLTTMTNEEAL